MKVVVNVKQIGKRKNAIDQRVYELKAPIGTVEDLIKAFVRLEVEAFNQRTAQHQLVDFLTNEQISDFSASGKIAFDLSGQGKKQALDKAIENALLSYQDGIYCIFLNEERLTADLKEAIHLKEGDGLTFVRLTMLSGRLW